MASLVRSEEHTSELQSLTNLVCRLLLEKKNKKKKKKKIKKKIKAGQKQRESTFDLSTTIKIRAQLG